MCFIFWFLDKKIDCSCFLHSTFCRLIQLFEFLNY
ncbi:unnamed protein product [Chironomus riparius]|uniref:Uncharacterized protein n=1 Tax=Chironomus riparius TaxID=315576 RepID=A0A9N9RLF9_9DIPT|nr:unnamed protein product [Chironomus riparius]